MSWINLKQKVQATVMTGELHGDGWNLVEEALTSFQESSDSSTDHMEILKQFEELLEVINTVSQHSSPREMFTFACDRAFEITLNDDHNNEYHNQHESIQEAQFKYAHKCMIFTAQVKLVSNGIDIEQSFCPMKSLPFYLFRMISTSQHRYVEAVGVSRECLGCGQ
jgi:hypothetical protein